MSFEVSKYLGKTFIHGSVDCYGLVREFYKKEFDLDLTNYARSDFWWNNGENLYMENFKKEGFYLLNDSDEPQFGDLYLIALNASVACHAAIYIGDNKILHHVINRLSAVDKYRGCWRNWTVARIRHISNKKEGKDRTQYDFGKKHSGKSDFDLF